MVQYTQGRSQEENLRQTCQDLYIYKYIYTKGQKKLYKQIKCIIVSKIFIGFSSNLLVN